MKKYNRLFHSGPVKGICDVCKNKNGESPFIHLPHLAELNGKNFWENQEIAKRLKIPSCCLCWKCFHSVFKGEK